MVDVLTSTAIIGASVLVIVAGAFLGVGFILALLAMLWAILAALLSNLWRVVRGTTQSAINFFTLPLAMQWGFTALVLIWLFGLPIIEFQNGTMQSLDVFYECFVYDVIDNFVDVFGIPLRNIYNFIVVRWNDLILYLRDCVKITIDEFPDIIDPSIPTPAEVVQAFCAVVDGLICVILFPVSIESFEIPFLTDVVRGLLDTLVCIIQLVKEFISAVILDPLGFFNGPCFVILAKLIECFRIFILWITVSGFNGLLDDFINALVDNVACYLFWGKQVAIDIAKLDLFDNWVDRGTELCMCIGDTWELATGGLLPGIGDFIECICLWVVEVLRRVLDLTLPRRMGALIIQFCSCIEDHLLPLFSGTVFEFFWTTVIEFIVCQCRLAGFIAGSITSITFISRDCYMCQRCPTCAVSQAGVTAGCGINNSPVPLPPIMNTIARSYSRCAGSTILESCSDCCDECEQYCDCQGCHDFVADFVHCWCDFINAISFELLDEIPFGIDFGEIFLLACEVLIKVLNLWRPVVRTVLEFGLCKTSDIFDGVQEILFEFLAILDCMIVFISLGEDCEAFSPIPIPAFIPLPPGICDNFIFVLFLQLVQFILDIILGLGLFDIINAIICIVTSGYDVCIGIFPTGQGGQCDLSACWDSMATCVSNIGGIWTPILPPNPFFDNVSLVFNVLDFVLCPVRDILNCWTTFAYQGVINFSTLDDIVLGLQNALICSAAIPVGTAGSVFPFASFVSIINPLLDIYNAFFANVPANPFAATSLTAFSSFTNFLFSLFNIQWVGQPLLLPWLNFIIKPAFDLLNCFMAAFPDFASGLTNVDNSPINIIQINARIFSFINCIRQISVAGFLVFRPLTDIVLLPIIKMWEAVINIVNPRPNSFTEVFNRIHTMCTNLSLVTFGSDNVSIFRWFWDFILMLKSALQCIFDTPTPGPGLINAMSTLQGVFGGGLSCIVNVVEYSSPGIPAFKPFKAFFRGFQTIVNFISQTFAYFIDLFFWIDCLSEAGGCCSNPVTETSEFISEISEITEALTCLFTEFPDFTDIPCVIPGTCKRSENAAEDGQQSLDLLRVKWNNFLEFNMSVPRNSTCGESLYDTLPGEIDEVANWVEAMRYFSCIGMMKIGDSMIKQNSSLTHKHNFDCPTHTIQTVIQQLQLYNETDLDFTVPPPVNGTSVVKRTEEEEEEEEQNEITFDTFLRMDREDYRTQMKTYDTTKEEFEY